MGAMTPKKLSHVDEKRRAFDCTLFCHVLAFTTLIVFACLAVPYPGGMSRQNFLEHIAAVEDYTDKGIDRNCPALYNVCRASDEVKMDIASQLTASRVGGLALGGSGSAARNMIDADVRRGNAELTHLADDKNRELMRVAPSQAHAVPAVPAAPVNLGAVVKSHHAQQHLKEKHRLKHGKKVSKKQKADKKVRKQTGASGSGRVGFSLGGAPVVGTRSRMKKDGRKPQKAGHAVHPGATLTPDLDHEYSEYDFAHNNLRGNAQSMLELGAYPWSTNYVPDQ